MKLRSKDFLTGSFGGLVLAAAASAGFYPSGLHRLSAFGRDYSEPLTNGRMRHGHFLTQLLADVVCVELKGRLV